MVNVRVRDHNLLHLQVMFDDDGENVFNLVARIDDHGLTRSLIADDGAVALQCADREDFVDHGVHCRPLTLIFHHVGAANGAAHDGIQLRSKAYCECSHVRVERNRAPPLDAGR